MVQTRPSDRIGTYKTTSTVHKTSNRSKLPKQEPFRISHHFSHHPDLATVPQTNWVIKITTGLTKN